MIIVVQTHKCMPIGTDDIFEGEFHINDERHEGRQRLARHAWWAMRNGRSITTFPKGI